eukprot:1159089-Pelagomonas_calceolata.AAC.16
MKSAYSDAGSKARPPVQLIQTHNYTTSAANPGGVHQRATSAANPSAQRKPPVLPIQCGMQKRRPPVPPIQ